MNYYSPDGGGISYTSDIVKGISYARNKGAQVIVGNWRVGQYNAYLESKIKESGILFIAPVAEGNIFPAPAPAPSNIMTIPISEKEYPACFDIENVLAVGSVDSKYNKYFVELNEEEKMAYKKKDNIDEVISFIIKSVSEN